jgi:error-prone DNA polymerase
MDTLNALAKADVLKCFGSRRDVLWLLGVLASRQPLGDRTQARLLESALISDDDLAWLEELDESEAMTWDLQTTRTSLVGHPMALLRPELEALGVRRLDRIYDGQHCTIAGLVIARQHP